MNISSTSRKVGSFFSVTIALFLFVVPAKGETEENVYGQTLVPTKLSTPDGEVDVMAVTYPNPSIYDCVPSSACFVTSESVASNESLIGASLDGHYLLNLLSLREGKLFRLSGDKWAGIKSVYSLKNKKRYQMEPLEVSAEDSRSNCTYRAPIDAKEALQVSIFSNDANVKLNFEPSAEDFSKFNRWSKKTDDEDGQPTELTLIATSDIDGDGRKEFWYREQGCTDGFGVGRISDDGKDFIELASDYLVGCGNPGGGADPCQ